MRTRRRSHHVAAETIEEHVDDLPQANKPSKRQRRLTAHQRTNAALVGLKQLQAPNPAAAAAVPAPKQAPNPPVAQKVEEKPAPREPEKPKESSSMSDSDTDSDFEPSSRYNQAGYISSGTSAKMAPGKRIKWRTAISEGDIIRQDLSLAFLFASLNSTDAAEQDLNDTGKQQVCEPPCPLKPPASAVRSKRR